MALIDLPGHNGATFMRMYNVGAFGYWEVEEASCRSLKAELMPVDGREVFW